MTESKAVADLGTEKEDIEDLADAAKVLCTRRNLDRQFAYLENHPFDEAARQSLIETLGPGFDRARAAWLRLCDEAVGDQAS